MEKRESYRRESEPRISRIMLDEETRKRILMDLGVEGELDWIPEVIHVTRVNRGEVGLAEGVVRPNSWILVMV